MNPFVGRGLAAVGAILAVVAIWVELTDLGGKYWEGGHHIVGIVMLVLGLLVGAGILAASVFQNRAIDQLWLIPGLVLGGLQFFLPLSGLAAGNADHLAAGAWLGVAALGLFALAGITNAIPELTTRTDSTSP
jgi:hypothetical protein